MSNKITVGMTQKINLGGYETRDYFVQVEKELLDGESTEDAIKELKEKCEKEVVEYYNKIKEELIGLDKLENDELKRYKELEKKIDSSKTEDDVRSNKDEILLISDDNIKKVMLKKFNTKLLKLKSNA